MKHFEIEDFNCPCCNQVFMHGDFLISLDDARELADVPFKITSGYRCSKYQKALKERGYETAHGISPHQKGVACDISVINDERRWQIINALFEVGFTRIGIGSNFVHVDKDLDRNMNRIWYYKR